MAKAKLPEKAVGKDGRKGKLAQQRQAQREQVRWISLAIAGIVATLAVIGGLLHTPNRVIPLSLDDSDKLRGVLYGGKPWLIHCIGNHTSESMHALSSETGKMLKAMGDVNVGAIDCDSPLPKSGKSLKQKFFKGAAALPGKPSSPDYFLSANGDPPMQVPSPMLLNAKKLTEWAHTQALPRIHSVTSSPTLHRACFKLTHRPCFLLISGSQKPLERKYKWLNDLVREFRTVRLGSVNSTGLRTNFDSSLPPVDPAGHPTVIALQRSGRGASLDYSARVWRDGAFNQHGLQSFISDVQSGAAPLTTMSKKPAIRSSKKEIASEAKKSSTKPRQSAPPSQPSASRRQAPPEPPATLTKKETQQERESRRRQEMEEQEMEDALVWDSEDFYEEDAEVSDDLEDYDEEDVVVF
mmetsp:Transcript_36361/g.50517  ORF Transcript_36361/g.50517 Transcript_36361/m.50517 type:complete len:410 (-) Transcript_36361:381-1610(-)|eukprot:CAMPEP_0196583906 /NCGR_PEP_ID=MMETSP1081-20130531/45133_1 /TAXON_ID=36882 /ORGANISM="Pyramimonas amylifera, Strain CCMP720" /LENGTH=409 /DNA_ID=CAMNT_0041904941 /DNA_START=97 /DNA_END=1326 /DNA_ORIENTATION=-